MKIVVEDGYITIDFDGGFIKILLEEGKSVPQALRDWAEEQREHADRLDRLANRAIQMAKLMEGK